ncbi:MULTISPECIES: signal peptidase I [Kitasatospora]|uniref:Signal peptidase I n=1 Tax=Kitasatospora setae (strain ATCC 33774 / DSM 43861 / JCM 3304 / KCC A-0304 / NBRC 14216 / KM-6054) TaxID=452652 RepID=E4NHJ2_KITSK|nr:MULTISPECIES: signal peptidase I [Kitasatospora]BAJ30972.1 putative signal peptidase I [Kitasatospora setae KM-6054]
MGSRGRPRTAADGPSGSTDPGRGSRTGAAPGTDSGPEAEVESVYLAEAGADDFGGDGAEGGDGDGDAPGERPLRGRAERRRAAKRAARRRRRSLLRELPVIMVVALVIALVMKTFLIQVFVIPSGSMEQTLQVGDRVVVDKLTPWFGSEPQRGQVVVFKDPGGWLENDHKPSADGPVLRNVKALFSAVGLLPSDDERDLIKRVIGVGGDTVECCDQQGRVSVNGTPLNEPYVSPGNAPSRITFKVTVPQGRLWVMGDHRDLSADSRYHMGNPGSGSIPVENVVGRAFVVAWPLSHFGQLDVPDSLSSLPGRVTGSEPIGPVPAEPPLVMGVLGVLPLLTRYRATHRRGGPVAD